MTHSTAKKSTLSDFSKIEILKELNRILSSSMFIRSSVLSRFLKFIVEETLEGNTDSLKEYTIAVSALRKSSDFNPQIDAIVRIHAGRLRRLLNEYYLVPGALKNIKIEVLKGTYVPAFRAHLTKKLKVDNLENKDVNISTKNDKSSKMYSRTKITIAVLPFRNLCPNEDYQFFVDGLGEELTQHFSAFQNIEVIAHHSTRKYITQPEDIRVIGSDLGVHYIISGSVRRSSEDIRVNVELLKTLDGTQVWSRVYNYKSNIENLMFIQDQIVENVCSVLGGYYGFIIHNDSSTIRQKVSNIDSFDAAYWNYYFHMNYSEVTYLKTREALERALEHDPNYATGLAMLAELYVLAQSLGYPTVEEPVKLAFELTKRALRIDPLCQHAHQELGWIYVYLQNKDEAVKALEYSLKLNPYSVSRMGGVGFNLACAGEYKRAEVLLSKSLNLNPHCPWWFYFGFFLVYYQTDNYTLALKYANKIETVDVFFDPLLKAAAKGQLGMLKEAEVDVELLNTTFSNHLSKVRVTLDAFILDKPLIEKIIDGINKAGLQVV